MVFEGRERFGCRKIRECVLPATAGGLTAISAGAACRYAAIKKSRANYLIVTGTESPGAIRKSVTKKCPWKRGTTEDGTQGPCNKILFVISFYFFETGVSILNNSNEYRNVL